LPIEKDRCVSRQRNGRQRLAFHKKPPDKFAGHVLGVGCAPSVTEENNLPACRNVPLSTQVVVCHEHLES
jgi:hypothetical protein